MYFLRFICEFSGFKQSNLLGLYVGICHFNATINFVVPFNNDLKKRLFFLISVSNQLSKNHN